MEAITARLLAVLQCGRGNVSFTMRSYFHFEGDVAFDVMEAIEAIYSWLIASIASSLIDFVIGAGSGMLIPS